MSTSGRTWRLGRRPALDGVRGVAILLVVAYHGLVLAGWTNVLTSAGTAGVSMFFTLSGFLITALLLEEATGQRRIRLRAFYERRARRLLPALVVLTLVCGLVATMDHGFISLGSAAASLLYVQNWWGIGHPGSRDALNHTWSLSIEEQFYILWPLILVALMRGGRRAVLWVALGGALASLALRIHLSGTTDAWRIYAGTDTRADGLLLGCALAAAVHSPKVRALGSPLLACAAVAVLLPSLQMLGYGYQVVAPATASLACAALILAGVTTGVPGLCVGWLRWFGRRSYGLYLWHIPVMLLLGQSGAPVAVAVPAYLVCAVALTAVSWRYVEQPFMRPRRRLLPQSAPVEHAAQTI